MTGHVDGPLTHKRVLKISIPIVLSNATIPILGAVDTGVVGQMGDPVPIGAVGIGAIILSAVYWIFGFLRMGTAGLAAQARGANDSDEVAALLSRVLLIGFAAGALLILCQVFVFAAAFAISPASPEVEAGARTYMQIRIFSAPAAIALYGITGWLVAQERTAAVLVLQLWMNGVNILLDLWFVLDLGWGVEGVAIATFIAEWSALGLGLWLCRAVFKGAAWRAVAQVFDRARLIVMARVNRDILIRSVLLQTIMLSFLFYASDFGNVELAANQILLQFLYITSYAMDGFAFAAEAMVGSAMGARDPARLRRAAMLSSLWGLLACGGLCLAFALFGGAIIDLMTTAPEVRETARVYLIYMVLTPLLGVAAWMLDGIFIGATRTVDMRNMMMLSALIYAVAVAILVPLYGNHGLWMALVISFAARGITLGARYPALERAAA